MKRSDRRACPGPYIKADTQAALISSMPLATKLRTETLLLHFLPESVTADIHVINLKAFRHQSIICCTISLYTFKAQLEIEFLLVTSFSHASP